MIAVLYLLAGVHLMELVSDYKKKKSFKTSLEPYSLRAVMRQH